VLLVGNVGDGTVTVVDATALKVLGAINVIPDGNTPRDPVQALVYPALVRATGTNYVQGLAVPPDAKTLYVSRGFLSDVPTLAVDGSLQVDARVRPFTFTTDGRRAYVQFSYYNGFQEVDAVAGAVLRSAPLPVMGPAVGESPSNYPNEAAHHGIALTHDGG